MRKPKARRARSGRSPATVARSVLTVAASKGRHIQPSTASASTPPPQTMARSPPRHPEDVAEEQPVQVEPHTLERRRGLPVRWRGHHGPAGRAGCRKAGCRGVRGETSPPRWRTRWRGFRPPDARRAGWRARRRAGRSARSFSPKYARRRHTTKHPAGPVMIARPMPASRARVKKSSSTTQPGGRLSRCTRFTGARLRPRAFRHVRAAPGPRRRHRFRTLS